MSGLVIIDYIFLLIILVIAISATIKGFLGEVFSKAAFFLGIILALVFYGKLMPYMAKWVSIPFLQALLSFVAIFIGVYLVLRIIQVILKKIFLSGNIMKGLDKSLGFFLGIIEGFIVVFLVLFLINALPFENITQIVRGSFFQKIFIKIISNPTQYINSLVTA
ncbi:MAG: CvpA family protein [Treponema sp.]|nr:CvpA family protein [Candidatus Treponema caballi]